MDRPPGILSKTQGLLAGIGVGTVLGGLFFFLCLPALGNFAGERGWGLIVLCPAGTVLSALVGGIFGVRFARKNRQSRGLRVLVALLGFSTLAAALIGVVVVLRAERDYRARQSQAINATTADWNATYGVAYPKSEDSLPALLGPLRYPGSRLIAWNDTPPDGASTPYVWIVETGSDDELATVLDYYITVLPEGLQAKPGTSAKDPWRFVGEPQLSADGRATLVSICDCGEGVVIRFDTRFKSSRYRKHVAGPPIGVAWPESESVHRAHVSEYQAHWRDAMEDALGPVVYPGARRISLRFPNSINTLPAPNGVYIADASWEAILKHLQGQFGPPRWGNGNKTHINFEGDISDTTGNTYRVSVDAYATIDGGPFDAVVLSYDARPLR